ncbi:CDP-diacylglycerol--glycerol-3-phosphate 3-phosphatidyltransferase [Halovulum sp. GXIMD14793]
MPINLPNILTILRLLAAPGVAFVFLLADRPTADWIALILFVTAALTDFFDGWLARRWNQISAFGRMLDPIADKAMVVIALAVILGFSGMQAVLVVPVTLILFREVFVSGLREYLGNKAKELRVTLLAKWKTTVQMLAIAALFYMGIAQWKYEVIAYQFDPYHADQIISGAVEDEFGLVGRADHYILARNSALALIWVAAVMTVLSGIDYFIKSLPLLREQEQEG